MNMMKKELLQLEIRISGQFEGFKGFKELEIEVMGKANDNGKANDRTHDKDHKKDYDYYYYYDYDKANDLTWSISVSEKEFSEKTDTVSKCMSSKCVEGKCAESKHAESKCISSKPIEFYEDKDYLKLQATSNIKDALPLATSLIKAYPESEPFVYRNLGAIWYFYEGNIKEARECFAAACFGNSDDSDSYALTMLGIIYEDEGYLYDAEHYFKMAAGVKHAFDGNNNLAYFYIRNNRLKDAKLALDDAVGTSLHVSSFEGVVFYSIKLTKAVVKLLGGDTKSAKILFEDAFKQYYHNHSTSYSHVAPPKKMPSKEAVLTALEKYLGKDFTLRNQEEVVDKILSFVNSLEIGSDAVCA